MPKNPEDVASERLDRASVDLDYHLANGHLEHPLLVDVDDLAPFASEEACGDGHTPPDLGWGLGCGGRGLLSVDIRAQVEMIVVDSPPGMISAQQSSSSCGLRTVCADMPDACSISICF